MIVEARQTKGGSPQSFWVLTSEGRLKLRNMRFLRPFVMEENNPEVLRAQSVKLMTIHVAEALHNIVSKYIIFYLEQRTGVMVIC